MVFRDSQGRVQRVGAYAICVDERHRLLTCRLTAETGRPGWWTIPGGGIDFGEHPDDALVREVREETGYDVRIIELILVDSHARGAHVEGVDDVPYHGVRFVYRAEIIGGSLTHETHGSSDLAAWHTRAELAALQRNELADLALTLDWG